MALFNNTNPFADYIRALRANVERGDATEHTHRPALKALLEAVDPEIVATNEPRRIACGAPDFNITRNGVPVGHIETKDIGVNLDDDSIKFIRFAQWRINQTGHGIVGFITNNSYLDVITHRRMRKSLLESFDEIYVLNLHGSSKKKEKAPDGGKDDNVFDITVGVSILLAVKNKVDEASRLVPTRRDAASTLGCVHINTTQYFGGILADVWNFRIGGYQVCEKWLKDRKGRTLDYADIQHYQRIVVALSVTIRLMGDIDRTIEVQGGGWPEAFEIRGVKRGTADA